MTSQKHKKRRVRARMEKTGESYQPAHRAVERASGNKTEPQADFGDELLVIPMRNAAVFPGASGSFDIGRVKSVAVVQAVSELPNAVIAVFSQRDAGTDDPDASDLYPVGCAARVVKAKRHESGNYSLLLRGLSEIRLEAVLQREPFLRVRVSRVESAPPSSVHGGPTNLDFAAREQTAGESADNCKVSGWAISGVMEADYSAELTGESFEGKPVVCLRRSVPGTEGMASMSQQFKADAYRGKRIRFSAALRTTDATPGASMSLCILGPDGRPLGGDGPRLSISGTTEWAPHSCVMDVPPNAKAISIANTLFGSGELHWADLRFEIVAKSVPVTARIQGDAPTNLDFAAPLRGAGEPPINCPIDGWFMTGSHAPSYSAELANESFEGKPTVRMWRSDDGTEGFGGMCQRFGCACPNDRRQRHPSRCASDARRARSSGMDLASELDRAWIAAPARPNVGGSRSKRGLTAIVFGEHQSASRRPARAGRGRP